MFCLSYIKIILNLQQVFFQYLVLLTVFSSSEKLHATHMSTVFHLSALKYPRGIWLILHVVLLN